MSKISVLLRTHNRRVWAEEALQSILGQENATFEAIVTDNYSSDGTWEWLQSLNDSRIKLRHPNADDLGVIDMGPEVTGDYVNFFCDDDVMLPGALALKSRYLDEHPERPAVFTSCQNTAGELLAMGFMGPVDMAIGASFESQFVSCSMPIGTVMLRADLARAGLSAVKEMRLTSEDLRGCSDWLLWLACLRIWDGVAYLATPTFKYRVHDETESNDWGWKQGGFARTHKAVWKYFTDQGFKMTHPQGIKALSEIAQMLGIEAPLGVLS